MNALRFLLLMLLPCVAGAQIGGSPIGFVSLGGAAIGSVRNVGKSTLPVCLPGEGSCNVTYRFIGNGAWTMEENWLGNKIPPALLPAGYMIIVDPENGGECLLNVFQIISSGAALELLPAKRLKILTGLVFQE